MLIVFCQFRWYSYTKSLEILFLCIQHCQFPVSLQMHFIFVDKVRGRNNKIIFSDRICVKRVGEGYATYIFFFLFSSFFFKEIVNIKDINKLFVFYSVCVINERRRERSFQVFIFRGKMMSSKVFVKWFEGFTFALH